MRQERKEELLIKLDEFIQNLDNDNNNMSKLIEEATILEMRILKSKNKFDSIYIDTIVDLKNTLIDIKDKQEAIQLLKNTVNQDKKLTQKLLLKLQEKGINVKNIISDLQSDIAKLEPICKNYTQYRDKVKKESIVSNNNLPSKHTIKKLNIRFATFTLLALTTISSTGYITFKLLNSDDTKNISEINTEIEKDELNSDETNITYNDLRENNNSITHKTVIIKNESIISTQNNVELKIIERDDFSNYPELNCDNKHVYYRFAKSYEFSEEELLILMKVVTKEAGEKDSGMNYDELKLEAMNVTTTILNRFEDKEYYASHGTDLIEHLSAYKQFTTYESALKMNNNDIPDAVKDGVLTTLNGIRTHEFIQFRANGNKASDRVLITPHGNNYFDVMNPVNKIEEFEYVKNK